MISIHAEMTAIANGAADKQNNVLKNAPHTAGQIAADKWDRPYSREQAAFPAPWLRDYKFWPSVARVDNVLRRSQFVLLLRPARRRGRSRKINGGFSRWLEHRLGACAPSGDSPRCSFTQCQRSKTPLGAQTGSLCSASVPLENGGFLRNACTSNRSLYSERSRGISIPLPAARLL